MTIDLYDAMSTLRAVRKLRPDPIPDDVLDRVLQAAGWATTGGNQQPWKVVVVTDPAKKEGLQDIYRPQWQRYVAGFMGRLEGEPDEVVEPWRRVAAAGDHLADHLHEAPVLLFVAGWTRRGQEQSQALFPCIQNVLLACRAVGLGASLTTLHRAFGEEIDRWLGLPEKCPTCAMLPIGWPAGRHGRPPRRSVDECLFWERYSGEEGNRSGG